MIPRTTRLAVALAAFLLPPGTSFAIQIAGSLIVDLDSTRAGDVTTDANGVTSWANLGTAGVAFTPGAFQADNLAAAQPDLQTVGGVSAIVFDGGSDAGTNPNIDRLEAPPAPASVTANSDWSFEAWAYNPSISTASPGQEETIFQWGPRGGVAGTSTAAHVGMGFAGPSGAVVHWGADQGYTADANTQFYTHDTVPALNGNAPIVGQWHHIAVTYAGGVNGNEIVYLDGQPNNSALRTLNVSTAINMIVGTGFNNNSVNFQVPGSLSIARVRLHDNVLSPADVLANFDEEKATFGIPEPSSLLLGVLGLCGLSIFARRARKR